MALPQQVGLCKSLAKAVPAASPGPGPHRGQEDSESGHEVSRGPVLPRCELGTQQEAPSQCHGKTDTQSPPLPLSDPSAMEGSSHHGMVTVLGKRHQHRDTVSLEQTSHPKATGSDDQGFQSRSKPEPRRMQRGPSH